MDCVRHSRVFWSTGNDTHDEIGVPGIGGVARGGGKRGKNKGERAGGGRGMQGGICDPLGEWEESQWPERDCRIPTEVRMVGWFGVSTRVVGVVELSVEKRRRGGGMSRLPSAASTLFPSALLTCPLHTS